MVNNQGTLFKTWDEDSMQIKMLNQLFCSIEGDLWLYDSTILALNHLYILSGMCCPLILYREEIMSRAESLTQCQDPQKKGQKDGMAKE